MPVLALNSGRIWPNSPESCVEVVEETTIDFSAFARAGETASRATKAPMTVSSRDITRNPPFGWKSHNVAGEPPCFAEIHMGAQWVKSPRLQKVHNSEEAFSSRRDVRLAGLEGSFGSFTTFPPSRRVRFAPRADIRPRPRL